MKIPVGAVSIPLLVGFLLVPWPLVRWACLTAFFFVSLSWIWSLVLKKGIRIDDSPTSQRSFSGQKTEISLAIENRSLLPAGVVFFFDSPDNLECWGETRFFVDLPPRRSARFSYHVRGRQRGLNRLGPTQISVTDPAGLFPFRRVAPRERLLLLYPPLVSLENAKLSGMPPGDRSAVHLLMEDISRLRTFRDFQEGDDLARLAPGESAKRGHPTVRLGERTASRATAVLLDFFENNYPLRRRWFWMERAVETATAVIWERLSLGEPVWLTSNGYLPAWDVAVQETQVGEGGHAGPAKGWASARPLLEMLALIKPGTSPEVGNSLSLWMENLPVPPARLYWIGALHPPREWLEQLRGYNVVFLQIGSMPERRESEQSATTVRINDYGQIDLEGF